MRCLTRMGLALLGLAVAAPTCALADPPSSADASQSKAKKTRLAASGWFRTPHLCPECQRKQLRAQGIEVPPPPPLPPSVMGQGFATTPNLEMLKMAARQGSAPGHAVVGESSPGYAVAGGEVRSAEPRPIGVVQANYNATVPPAAARPGMASRPMAMPPVPPPALPITRQGHNAPHVLGHMFGLTALGRRRREAWARQMTERHASISYGAPDQRIDALPASMVYGR